MGVGPDAFLVHEPVVHLELDPRRREHVDDFRRLERGAGQQLETDGARVGIQQVRDVRDRLAQRHVAPEPHAGAPHARTPQVVVRAVVGSRGIRLARRGSVARLECRLLGVVKIVLAQLVPKFDELGCSYGIWKLEPLLVGDDGHGVTPARTDMGPQRKMSAC